MTIKMYTLNSLVEVEVIISKKVYITARALRTLSVPFPHNSI